MAGKVPPKRQEKHERKLCEARVVGGQRIQMSHGLIKKKQNGRIKQNRGEKKRRKTKQQKRRKRIAKKGEQETKKESKRGKRGGETLEQRTRAELGDSIEQHERGE